MNGWGENGDYILALNSCVKLTVWSQEHRYSWILAWQEEPQIADR